MGCRLRAYVHFQEAGGSKITKSEGTYFMDYPLTNKTQASDPTKREFYWIRTLGTLYTRGLNIESDF